MAVQGQAGTQQELPGHLQWPAVGCLCIICWPVGLVLLAMRLNRDRSLMMSAGTVLCWIGGGIAVFFGLGLIVAISDRAAPPGVGVISLLFAAGGVALYLKGQKVKATATRARRYIDLIVNQQHTSVDSIASLLQRSDISVVMQEIQETIDSGFLKGYTLDPSTRLLRRMAPAVAPVAVAAGAIATPPMSFVCKACGARNESAGGGVARCEFCDTPHSG